MFLHYWVKTAFLSKQVGYFFLFYGHLLTLLQHFLSWKTNGLMRTFWGYQGLRRPILRPKKNFQQWKFNFQTLLLSVVAVFPLEMCQNQLRGTLDLKAVPITVPCMVPCKNPNMQMDTATTTSFSQLWIYVTCIDSISHSASYKGGKHTRVLAQLGRFWSWLR